MRNILANFPTEPVKILKPDGTEISIPQALIDPSSNLILISDATLKIEENDTISRILPSGDEECFIVVERGFVRGMGSIPDHYQVKVKKKTDTQSMYSAHPMATYNIGSAQKVNINSVDNSINYSLTQNEKELFTTLIALSESLPNKEAITTKIVDMEHSVGTSGFGEKYNSFIQSIANHISIFAPFIPMLTQFLIK